jgi:hypothetical protein
MACGGDKPYLKPSSLTIMTMELWVENLKEK